MPLSGRFRLSATLLGCRSTAHRLRHPLLGSRGDYATKRCDCLTRRNRVDKSRLSIAEPKRLRDPDHLKHVAAQPCLVCERKPAHAHHLTFAQPRAMGRKVSDEFTVPLCNVHHHDLHTWGNERLWWASKKLEPMRAATDLWKRQSRTSACSREPGNWRQRLTRGLTSWQKIQIPQVWKAS